MLTKSLIQFSVDGLCSLLLFGLRPNYGGGNEDNGSLLQKVPCTHCHTQCPWPYSWPPPIRASARYPWTLLGKSGSVSCGGHCSFLLGSVAHKVLFVPSRTLFPQFFVSSSSSLVGYGEPLQEGLCHTHVCIQSPYSASGHCWPTPPQETLKHSKVGLAQSLWVLLVWTRFRLSPPSISGGYGVSF